MAIFQPQPIGPCKRKRSLRPKAKAHLRLEVNLFLEDDLKRQLHVERLAGAYPRCAVVVSNGIRRHTQAAACQASAVAQHGGGGIAYTAPAAGGRQILSIEDIE